MNGAVYQHPAITAAATVAILLSGFVGGGLKNGSARCRIKYSAFVAGLVVARASTLWGHSDLFVEVSSKRDVATVARLAREIWVDHYTPIIGAGQVAYMLDKFQSPEAISRQIAHRDHWYFLIRQGNHAVGYIGLQRRRRVLFLSKLYVKKSMRGKGVGRRAVEFVLEFAAQHGLSGVRLTVNRHNTSAIAAYQHIGFIRSGEVVTDIGGDYVMDDYMFEFNLRRDAPSVPPNSIRDAASLILVRDGDTDPKVLVGRRASSNRFMPGMYVFPGGVLQPEDFHASAAGELDDSCAALMGVRGSPIKAAALAKTAIRETSEETGLILGGRGEVGEVSEVGWRAIKAAGLRPCLRSLTYLGRAVTPVSMPLRFNARFFMASESGIRGIQADTDELSDLQWIRPQEWRSLPMVDITIYLLNRFEQILQRAQTRQSFVFRHHRDRAHIRWQDGTPKLRPLRGRR